MFQACVVLCKYCIAVPLASVFAARAQFVPNYKFSLVVVTLAAAQINSFGASEIFLPEGPTFFPLTSRPPNSLSVWSPRWSSVIAHEWRMKSSARRPLVAEKVDTRKFSCRRTCRMPIDRNVSVAEATWRSPGVSHMWRISRRVCSCAFNDVRFSNREHPEPYGRGTTSARN